MSSTYLTLTNLASCFVRFACRAQLSDLEAAAGKQSADQPEVHCVWECLQSTANAHDASTQQDRSKRRRWRAQQALMSRNQQQFDVILCVSICLHRTAITPRQTAATQQRAAWISRSTQHMRRFACQLRRGQALYPAGITGLTTVWLLPFTAIVNSALSMLSPTARVSMLTPAAHT